MMSATASQPVCGPAINETALRVSGDLDFGQVWINCHLIQPAELPNGGYQHSGHGNGLSLLALDNYTRVKQITSALPRR